MSLSRLYEMFEWCDNRSGTYDFRITKASQLQNEYKNEYAKDEFLNKKININKIKLKSRFNV